jgi:hypothetical protein
MAWREFVGSKPYSALPQLRPVNNSAWPRAIGLCFRRWAAEPKEVAQVLAGIS